MNSLSRRLAKLESAAGLTGNELSRISDAELDERIVRAWAELDALGIDQTEIPFQNETEARNKPVLWRELWPMAADIEALQLKCAGLEFYDECADLSIEQIRARIDAHIARLGAKRNDCR
jgi:predicted nuclease with RNAse H fold